MHGSVRPHNKCPGQHMRCLSTPDGKPLSDEEAAYLSHNAALW